MCNGIGQSSGVETPPSRQRKEKVRDREVTVEVKVEDEVEVEIIACPGSGSRLGN